MHVSGCLRVKFTQKIENPSIKNIVIIFFKKFCANKN